MFSFELKTVFAAEPARVFAALTEPPRITRWDYCRWAQSDMRTGGKIRKRDEESRLYEGDIVIYEPPLHYGIVLPLPLDSDDPDEGRFLARQEFLLDWISGKTVLTVKLEGFPSEEICEREKNTWGGWFFEKLKKEVENKQEQR